MRFLVILIVNDDYQFITIKSTNAGIMKSQMSEFGEVVAILNEKQMKNIGSELMNNRIISDIMNGR